MKKHISIILAAVVLVGCRNNIPVTTTFINDNQVISMAKTLIADQMRDPEATKFKEAMSVYSTSGGDYIVCGTVNGKNAMGGYVGYKPFYARIRNGQMASFMLPSENDKYDIVLNQVVKSCSQAASGSMKVSS